MVYPTGMFGFTNEDDHIESVRAFVAAAVADGWSIEPTYGSEPVTSAARLQKAGYMGQALMRVKDKPSKWKYEAQISLWGPDGLAIKPPCPYDWNAITAGTTRCSACGADGVKTVRYSFAGRCCESCLPKMREQHERPGWTN